MDWKNVLWSPNYFAGSVGGAQFSMLKNILSNKKNLFRYNQEHTYIPSLKKGGYKCFLGKFIKILNSEITEFISFSLSSP